MTDRDALAAAHERSGAVVTIAVERRDDVSGANVVVVAADGRVVGYQVQPDPAEALSDLVDAGVHVGVEQALVYLAPGAEWSADAIPELLDQDVPVYAFEG